MAGQLPKGRGRRNRGRCGGFGGSVRANGGASAAQDPGDADRNGVLELGKRGELGCKPAQVITARPVPASRACGEQMDTSSAV